MLNELEVSISGWDDAGAAKGTCCTVASRPTLASGSVMV